MKEDSSKKEHKENSQWDKKKIFFVSLLLLVLLFLGYEIKSLFLDKTSNTPQESFIREDVKGASISSPESKSIKQTVQERIDSIKNEASTINISDIATSSPQIQKVINDLKAIQNYPSNELKNSCIKICNGL